MVGRSGLHIARHVADIGSSVLTTAAGFGAAIPGIGEVGLGAAALGGLVAGGLDEADNYVSKQHAKAEAEKKQGQAGPAPQGYYNPPRNVYHLNDMGTGPYGQSYGAYGGPVGSNFNPYM